MMIPFCHVHSKYVLTVSFFPFSCNAGSFPHKEKTKKVLDNNLQNEVLKNQQKRSRKSMVSIIL